MAAISWGPLIASKVFTATLHPLSFSHNWANSSSGPPFHSWSYCVTEFGFHGSPGTYTSARVSILQTFPIISPCTPLPTSTLSITGGDVSCSWRSKYCVAMGIGKITHSPVGSHCIFAPSLHRASRHSKFTGAPGQGRLYSNTIECKFLGLCKA